MSRTFRMTKQGYKTDWLPSYFEKYKEIRAKHPAGREGWTSSEAEFNEFLKNHPDHKNYFYEFGEPGPRWFRNAFTTRPRRAKERRLLNKIKSGYIDYDDAAFPIDKKPHIYWT